MNHKLMIINNKQKILLIMIFNKIINKLKIFNMNKQIINYKIMYNRFFKMKKVCKKTMKMLLIKYKMNKIINKLRI